MTYLEAESMRQEFNVAMQYQEVFPDKYKEVVKKYTAEQWVEFAKAILTKLEYDKVHLFELMFLVEAILKEE
jgi:hypothetical protein